MAQLKVFYEPAMELLTSFWQNPRPNQLFTELGGQKSIRTAIAG